MAFVQATLEKIAADALISMFKNTLSSCLCQMSHFLQINGKSELITFKFPQHFIVFSELLIT